MDTTDRKPGTSLLPLVATWFVLICLTLISPQMGDWLDGQELTQCVVAGIIWVKGSLVARHFIEVEQAHPFIRNVLRFFIAFTPIAIVLTTFFGDTFVRFATL